MKSNKPTSKVNLPSPHDWRTSDEDEIARRRQRAQTEELRVANLDPRHPIFSNFEVRSGSGLVYRVEIRSISRRRFSCECVDFRINALGTCKHVEAVLFYLEARHSRLFRTAAENGHGRIDIVPDLHSGTLRIENGDGIVPRSLLALFDPQGRLRNDEPEPAVELLLRKSGDRVRISQDVIPWLETRRWQEERRQALREYRQRVQSGEWPAQETLVPLYPYQREGMLHLAFKERALLADEMGLGKTIQAIAACALMHLAKRRPLTQQESDKLLRELNMMRMICDSNYILDPEDRTCPKIGELEKLLEECRENSDVKVLIFSEWARMLELIRELCERMHLGYAWHTGTVPQRRRRAEILMFKNDPECRVFLSTDSGSTGLNLQNASVIINCDLPWNPARLEQRIARAWRKHQVRPVTVINLVSHGTIESRMLETLSIKQALADGVLDLRGDLRKIQFRGGRQAFLSRLEQLMTESPPAAKPPAAKEALPVDRSLAFGERAARILGKTMVWCEERYPLEGPHSVIVVVVERDAPLWQQKLAALHEELFKKNGSDPLAPTTFQVLDRSTDETVRAPGSLIWGEALPAMRDLAGGTIRAVEAVIGTLQPLLRELASG